MNITDFLILPHGLFQKKTSTTYIALLQVSKQAHTKKTQDNLLLCLRAGYLVWFAKYEKNNKNLLAEYHN